MNPKGKEEARVKKELSDDCLHSLTITGRALIWSTIIIGLPSLIYTLVTGRNSGLEFPGDGAYSGSLVLLSGLIILIYVAIKKFQKARKGTPLNNE